jgi:Zn ribbon nucleic-acid-binding protein
MQCVKCTSHRVTHWVRENNLLLSCLCRDCGHVMYSSPKPPQLTEEDAELLLSMRIKP